MYQSVIFVLFSSTLSFASSPKEISKIFSDFNSKKAELFKADLSKKNAKDKVSSTYRELEKAMDEVKKIEARSNDSLLTAEGNQMAYDLEILSPLKDLATGLMNKEECNKAQHEHELNFPVVEDDDSEAIKKVITKICSE